MSDDHVCSRGHMPGGVLTLLVAVKICICSNRIYRWIDVEGIGKNVHSCTFCNIHC